MTDKLKPVRCGCGGEAKTHIANYYGQETGMLWVVCDECGMSTKGYATEVEAVQAWNRAMGAKDINVPNKERSDLISRKDTYEVLTDYYHHKENVQHEALREALNRVPSAEPERKTGKWEERDYLDNSDYAIPEWQTARCSVCGKYHTTPYQYYFTDYPYCPSCGADMRGDR